MAEICGTDAVGNQSARGLFVEEQVDGDQHVARCEIDLLDETVSRVAGKPKRGDDVAQQWPSHSQPGLRRGILTELTQLLEHRLNQTFLQHNASVGGLERVVQIRLAGSVAR